MRLADKYRPLALAILLLLCFFVASSQTYNPSIHTVTNKAIGFGQATPGDARSMFFDGTNFIYRAYQNTSEVKSYLNLAKYRYGNFIIVIDSGGLLQPNGAYVGGINTFWMFKDSTADANLVELNLLGSSGTCAGCLLKINNLSDLNNAATARGNLGLGTMATQSIAAGGDLSGSWPSVTVSKFNGQLPSFYLNYLNLSNTPAIPAQLNPTGVGLVTITGTYPNLTFTGRTPGLEETIFQNNATSRTDSINIGTFLFRFYGTSAMGLPTGTTAQRPTSPATGDERYNIDSLAPEAWNGSAWIKLGTGGGGGGTGITALTGDGTASGTGSVPFTLATVNSNVFGSNTFLKFATNGKGLTTSATAVVSSDIISALGYTPYNATNPNGYIPLTALSVTNTGVQGNASYNNTTGVFNIPNYGADTVNSISGLTTLYQHSLKQNQLSGTGYVKFSVTTPSYLTPTQVTADLNIFTSSLQGLAPASGGGTVNFLRADGTWTTPGGGGTVTSFSAGTLSPLFTTSVATSTTTPALTFTLSNAAANTVFGNFTGSSAAPAFGKLSIASLATGTPNYLIGYDGSGNPTLLKPDTIFYRELGQPGDSVGWISSTGIVNFRLIRDSLNFHHVTNSDSSWTFYSTGGGNTNSNIGSGFRFAVPNTNNIKTLFCVGCTLDSTTNTNALTLTVSGGSQTFQQTLTTGSTLTGNNTINGGGFVFKFQNGVFNLDSANFNVLSIPAAKVAAFNLFGNSISVGQNATAYDSSYPKLIGDTLKTIINNFAFSGSGIFYATYIMDSLISGINNSSVTSVDAGYNDVRLAGGQINYAYVMVASGMKSMWVNHFAGRYIAGSDTTTAWLKRSGTWITGLNAVAWGGKTKNAASTSTLNDSVVYRFVGNNAAVVLRGGDSVNVSGTQVSVYLDNVFVATYNCNGVADGVTVLGVPNTAIPYSIIVSGLTFGNHSLKLVNSAAKPMLVDYFTVLSPHKSPFIIWHTIIPTFSGQTPYIGLNTRIDSMAATLPSGYPTIVVPVNDVYTIAGTSSDSIHPSNLGHSFLFRSWANQWFPLITNRAGTIVRDSFNLYLVKNGYIKIPTVRDVWNRGETELDFQGFVNIPANSSFKQGGTDVYKADVLNKNTFLNIGTTVQTITPTAQDNFFAGNSAGLSLTTGIRNVAIGSGSLQLCTSCQTNMAIGAFTLQQSTTAVENTAIGYRAATANQTGSLIVAIGGEALQNVKGSNNTGVGGQVGQGLTTGTGNSLYGYQAGNSIVTTNFNTMGGYQSSSSTTSAQNTTWGAFANAFQTSGPGNTAVGYQAGYGNGVPSIFQYSVALGYVAGKNFGSGSDRNIAIGDSTYINAGSVSVTGHDNLIIGGPNDTLPTVSTSNFINIKHTIFGDAATGRVSIKTSTIGNSYMNLPASTTTISSLNIPAGTAPTSPNHGDVYTDANHIYARLNGVTYQLDQQGTSNIYNTDGTLTANRTLSGGTFNMNIGATGSKIQILTTNTINGTVIGTGGFDIGGSSSNAGRPFTLEGNAALVSGGNHGVFFSSDPGTNNDPSSTGTVATIYTHTFASATFTATSAVTYSKTATVFIAGIPTASTNVTFTKPYALEIGSGDVLINGNVFQTGNTTNTTTHFISNGSPSITAGSGAGTSPTISITGTDMGGVITLTTGTTPGLSATIATITYQLTWGNNSWPVLTSANAATAALSGTTMVFTTGSTSNFTITSGTVALTGATTYKWYYSVSGQ